MPSTPLIIVALLCTGTYAISDGQCGGSSCMNDVTSMLLAKQVANHGNKRHPAEDQSDACEGASTCPLLARSTSVPDDVSLLQARSNVITRASTSEEVEKDAMEESDHKADVSGMDRSEDSHAKEETKSFMFLRHGESTGNAAGSFNPKRIPEVINKGGTADGLLTDKGERQAVNRVAAMHEYQQQPGGRHLIKQAQESELILVSPLRRAMATMLIFVAKVMELCPRTIDDAEEDTAPVGLHGLCYGRVPKVVVDVYLTEKRATRSEDIGFGDEDPISYLRAIGDKYKQGLATGPPHNLQAVYESLIVATQHSYMHEKHQATGGGRIPVQAPDLQQDPIVQAYAHKPGGAAPPQWQPSPRDAVTYADMIRLFKNHAVTYEEGKILIVGHSGWARSAFAPWLHKEAEQGFGCGAPELDDIQNENLLLGGREGVSGLNNAGLIIGELGRFGDTTTLVGGLDDREVDVIASFDSVVQPLTEPGNDEFPNAALSKHEFGMFNQIGEAERACQIPHGTCFVYGIFEKQLQGGLGHSAHAENPQSDTWSERVFTLSWSCREWSLVPGNSLCLNAQVSLEWSEPRPSMPAALINSFLGAEPRGHMVVDHVIPYLGGNGAHLLPSVDIHGTSPDGGAMVQRLRVYEGIYTPHGLDHADQASVMQAWLDKVQAYLGEQGPPPC